LGLKEIISLLGYQDTSEEQHVILLAVHKPQAKNSACSWKCLIHVIWKCWL